MVRKIAKIAKMAHCYAKYLFFLNYCKIKKINNQNIWLLAERGDEARDNSYHFYKYLKANHPEIKVKYIISPKSSDYQKINKKDRVIYGSKQHYVLFLTAGKLISTHTMGFSPDMSLFNRLNAAGKLNLPGQKILLQHGITQSFIPTYVKTKTKLDLFISGAKPEYDFLKKRFGYSDKDLKCTGFARFDALKNNPKNQILVMPTFRKSLNYTNNFKNTEYYKRWNSLLNNKKLLAYLDQHKTTLIFYPHYEIQKRIKDFQTTHPRIKIADSAHYDVQQLLMESKLLITDYSSVHFDFASMQKPVFYYQFDYDEFRKTQYAEGYFSYDKMGFGPVTTNEDKLVEQICQAKNSAKYTKRIKAFFPIANRSNCQRIYDAIIAGGNKC